MAETDKDFDGLDALLGAARDAVPMPSDALLARVLDDAEQVQAGFVPVRPASRRASFWAQISAALGGWQGMAGLATAGIAGLWLGISPPEALPVLDLAAYAMGTDSALVDVMPGFDLETDLLGEG